MYFNTPILHKYTRDNAIRILLLIIKIHMYKQNKFLHVKHDGYVLEYTIVAITEKPRSWNVQSI